MIKLYSGCKVANHIVSNHPYGRMKLPKETEYSYEPTGETIQLNSETLFGFKLMAHTYEYKTFQGIRCDIKDINKKSVIVYLNQSEIQQMYDDPMKFWEVYIEGTKTIINDEEVIIKNEEEYNKRKKG